MRRVGAGCAEYNCDGDGNERSHDLARIQSKIAHFKAAILGPDPKTGSSGDRSLTGTAHLFPTVPAYSTGWLIRHDRLDR